MPNFSIDDDYDNVATLEAGDEGALEFHASYKDWQEISYDFKRRIPSIARTWDGSKKVWLVDPKYGKTIVELCRSRFGDHLTVPEVDSISKTKQQTIDVRYVGATKEREDGTRSAYGNDGSSWSVVFPEDVLKLWFEGTTRRIKTKERMLYAVLGIKQTSDSKTIQGAYRRVARQWHPDVCSEPDATERFQEINHAYEILKDELTRRRYDAGLALMTMTNESIKSRYDLESYRSPLRCGKIVAKGKARLGRFVIDEILSWKDIVNDEGEILISSWRKGQDKWTERWRL